MGKTASKYYFAYGSNMSQEQMREICRKHEFVSLGKLCGFRFIIGASGYATIGRSENECVYGVVWKISDEDEQSIDDYEGVAEGCYKKEYLPIIVNDNVLSEVLVYVDPETTQGKAEQAYMKKILLGAAEHNLPESYQIFLSKFIT